MFILGGTRIPKRNAEKQGNTLKHISFVSLNFLETPKCQISKRRASENDEHPRQQIFKILDMGSISIKKHEIEIW